METALNDEGRASYADGEPALFFNERGGGFAYYRNGRPAAFVSCLNDYQRKTLIYGNDTAKTLLASFDENAVGFALDTASEGRSAGRRLVLTSEGGLMSDGEGYIVTEWKWDPSRQGAGTPPRQPVHLQLSRVLSCIFTDRFNIRVVFSCDGIVRSFETGQKLRRSAEQNYLNTSTRFASDPAGTRRPDVSGFPTLRERTAQFNRDMVHLRNKNNPKSADLHQPDLTGQFEEGSELARFPGTFSGVVKGLEVAFKGYSEAHRVESTAPTRGWKETATALSLAEVPKFNETGFEVGADLTGSLVTYVKKGEDMSKTRTRGMSLLAKPGAPHILNTDSLKTGDGQWLGMLAVKTSLLATNPEITRSKMISGASGRYFYSRDALRKKNEREYSCGPLLESVRMAHLESAARGAPPEQLMVVMCTRHDDAKCCRAEVLVRRVNGVVASGGLEAGGAGGAAGGGGGGGGAGESGAAGGVVASEPSYRIMKMEMSENTSRKGPLTKKYNVLSVPYFLMFYGGQLVHASSLGGAGLRVEPTTKNSRLTPYMDQPPRVLLVDPVFRDQIWTEKVLKRNRIEWELALTGTEAAAHIKRLGDNHQPGQPSPEYGLVLLGEALSDADVKIIERAVRGKGGAAKKGAAKKGKNTLLVALTRNERRWKVQEGAGMLQDGVVSEALIAPPIQRPMLAAAVTGAGGGGAVTKPVHDESFVRLARRWATMVGGGEGHKRTVGDDGQPLLKGLTVDSMLGAMQEAREDGQKGRFLREGYATEHGLATASEETKWRGVKLTT
jgi:hypothetical protein